MSGAEFPQQEGQAPGSRSTPPPSLGSSPSGPQPFRRPRQSLPCPRHHPGRPRAQQLTAAALRSFCHACHSSANIRLRCKTGTASSRSPHSPATSATPPTHFRPLPRSKLGLSWSPLPVRARLGLGPRNCPTHPSPKEAAGTIRSSFSGARVSGGPPAS